MKQSKIMTMVCVLLLAFGIQPWAQEVLPDVVVKAFRYKYLSAVDQKELAQPVKMMERMAAEYNVKSMDYYEEDHDTYFVSFYIPQGQILASYNQEGKLVKTVGRFRDIELPKSIRDAVYKRFPGWAIIKDVYLVNYIEDTGAKKVYKMVLRNGDKRLRIKSNEMGEFL